VSAPSDLRSVVDVYAPHGVSPDPPFVGALFNAATVIGEFYQRAQVMEGLRDNEQRLSATMQYAAIGIAHVDDAGRFLYVNPQLCQMLGYTEHELISKTVKEVCRVRSPTSARRLARSNQEHHLVPHCFVGKR